MGISFDNVMDIMGAIMDETDSLIMGIGTPDAEDDPDRWHEWHFIPSHGDDGDFLFDISGVIEAARMADREDEWNHYIDPLDLDSKTETVISGIQRINLG